jgi:hypothetical protein
MHAGVPVLVLVPLLIGAVPVASTAQTGSAPPAPAAVPAAAPVPGAVPAPARTSVASAPEDPPAETLEEIVARLKRRLAQDEPARPVRTPRRPAAAPPRVTLVWRPAVVWPAELAGDATRGTSRRVTLSWDDAVRAAN